MNSKIAGYYRLSMEDDNVKEESNSITNQRLLIKKYVATQSDLNQMEYCEFYDDGVSGTTMDRPGMNKLLRACRNNEISCVIVKDISRFSRDYIELGSYMEQIFPFMGIRFIAITDNYDSKDYVGKTADIDIGFKSLLSDFYCKDVSTKVTNPNNRRKIFAVPRASFKMLRIIQAIPFIIANNIVPNPAKNLLIISPSYIHPVTKSFTTSSF